MGPTNIALVRLYEADQKVREAQLRLDAVSKNVRVQERKLADIAERLKLAQSKHREQQSQSAQLDLDIKSRDERIERLRTQQQTATNNREYQAFLIEINTEKVDKGKVEEEALVVMEQVEKLGAEVNELTQTRTAEQARLDTMKGQINEQVTQLQGEIDTLAPRREAAAVALPEKMLSVFERLANRFNGEALSALLKPDKRREEYICTACHMDLVTNLYNHLHSRDDLVYCPSCGRILYIPDDLPPEAAVNTRPKKASKKTEEAKS